MQYNSFETSLKPLIILMKLIGFQLDTITSRTSCWIMCAFFLLLNAYSNLSSLYTYLTIFGSSAVSWNGKATWSFLVDATALVGHVALVIGTHVGFFIAAWSGRWAKLWELLHKSQVELKADKNFHQRSLLMCFATIFLLAMASCASEFGSLTRYVTDVIRFRTSVLFCTQAEIRISNFTPRLPPTA